VRAIVYNRAGPEVNNLPDRKQIKESEAN